MNRAICAGLLLAASVWAQNVVAVKAGLVHHVEGGVYLDEAKLAPVKPEQLFSRPPQMKAGSIIRTTDGRAELLLSPGILLRLGEGTVVKMVSNELTDTRVELESGAVLLEVMDRTKDNLVTLIFKDVTIVPRREGIYRAGGAIPELMVYDGQADLVSGSTRQTLKRGRAVLLQELAVTRKFNPSRGDSLMQWSIVRSSQLALASRSVVGGLLDQRRGFRSNGWYWNPSFGLYTFVPFQGQYCGSFGYCFYTPQSYYSAFVAPRYQPDPGEWQRRRQENSGYGSSGGYQTSTQRTYEPPAQAQSTPPPAPAQAPPASSGVRGGEGAVSRGESGGRSQ